MIVPTDLIEVARLLSDTTGSGPASEASLRRAISSAYYALFHGVLRASADRFVGASMREKPAYALVYRTLAHNRIKDVCKAVNTSALSPGFQKHFGRTAVSSDMRLFASHFVELQEMRHRADYDPATTVLHSDALNAVEIATLGFEVFERIDTDEKTDLLAIMLTTVRN